MAADPQFRDNTDQLQYELETDAGIALVTYRDSPRGHRVLVHTEVAPAMQGLGVGSRLVKAVLDDARAHGRPIVPACEFVKSYLERHPEYADVVAGRV